MAEYTGTIRALGVDDAKPIRKHASGWLAALRVCGQAFMLARQTCGSSGVISVDEKDDDIGMIISLSPSGTGTTIAVIDITIDETPATSDFVGASA